ALEVLLFVGNGQQVPELVKYSGAGDLRSWLKAIATRLALRMQERRRTEDERSLHHTDSLDAAIADPELIFFKSSHRALFEEASRHAYRSLPSRDRNLLKQHHHYGLSTDELGFMLGVHKATAARWVSQARAALLQELRHTLLTRLRMGPSTM